MTALVHWRWSPGWLIPLAWLAFFWQLGTPPLYDLDEGAFTEATREMLASGNYITPYKDGEPRYDKPILIYWVQAVSVKLFGFNEWALRLPSALAASLWLWAIWSFSRQQFDRTTAFLAAALMALTLEVGLIGRAAIADALLNLFIALTFFDIYRYRVADSVRRSQLLLRIYLWLGLGFLTKGPVAVFFPFLVSVLYFFTLRDLSTWRAAVFAPRGWLIFLLIVVPWHVAIYFDNGMGFFASFFLKHNLGRFGGTLHGHAGFPGYYLLILPLILLPFSGWLVAILPKWRQLWHDPRERFLLLWFVCVLVFFSFSHTQLPHYLIYGITPLFILFARYRDELCHPWWAFLPPLIFMLLLTFLPELLAILAPAVTDEEQRALLQEGHRSLDERYRLITVTASVLVIGLWRYRRRPVWQRLLGVGIIQALLVFGVVGPRVLAVLQEPTKEAGLLARALAEPTVVYRTNLPSFSVYRQAVTPARLPRAGELVFLRLAKWPALQKHFPAAQLQVIYRRGAVMLVRVLPVPALVATPSAAPGQSLP